MEAKDDEPALSKPTQAATADRPIVELDPSSNLDEMIEFFNLQLDVGAGDPIHSELTIHLESFFL